MINQSNREKMMNELNNKEKICKNCGKKFIVSYPKIYTYKRAIRGKIEYFCSWSCYNKTDTKKKRKPYTKKAK